MISREQAVRLMLEACDNGDLNAAKNIQKQFMLDRDDLESGDAEVAFIRACRNGRLEMAQWLTETFNLIWEDVQYIDHWALIEACKGKHFEVVTWLIDTFYD